MENLQRTGSFKERGARNALLKLSEAQRRAGVVAASAGNHALGLAYHGSLLKIPVTVVMPARSNHRLADFVRARPMRDLAAAGVEFRLLPGMVHAKAVVIDETVAVCGSINVDLRSLLLNHEAAVVFYGASEIDWLADWIRTAAAQGEGYVPVPPGLLRDIAEGLLLTVAFQL